MRRGLPAPAMTAAEARKLAERERFECLERLLIETRGNIAEMARRMGKDRSTIRYHLRRYGMLGETGARRCPRPVDQEDRAGASVEISRGG